jgi:hypothetical protein
VGVQAARRNLLKVIGRLQLRLPVAIANAGTLAAGNRRRFDDAHGFTAAAVIASSE